MFISASNRISNIIDRVIVSLTVIEAVQKRGHIRQVERMNGNDKDNGSRADRFIIIVS